MEGVCTRAAAKEKNNDKTIAVAAISSTSSSSSSSSSSSHSSSSLTSTSTSSSPSTCPSALVSSSVIPLTPQTVSAASVLLTCKFEPHTTDMMATRSTKIATAAAAQKTAKTTTTKADLLSQTSSTNPTITRPPKSGGHLTINTSTDEATADAALAERLQPKSTGSARPHSATSMATELSSPDASESSRHSNLLGSPRKRNATNSAGVTIKSEPSTAAAVLPARSNGNMASITESSGAGGNVVANSLAVSIPPSEAPTYSAYRRRGCWRAKSSMYRGVSFNRKNQKWKAVLTVNCKQHFLGYFVNEIEAAKAYDREARSQRGDQANLNFTDSISIPPRQAFVVNNYSTTAPADATSGYGADIMSVHDNMRRTSSFKSSPSSDSSLTSAFHHLATSPSSTLNSQGHHLGHANYGFQQQQMGDIKALNYQNNGNTYYSHSDSIYDQSEVGANGNKKKKKGKKKRKKKLAARGMYASAPSTPMGAAMLAGRAPHGRASSDGDNSGLQCVGGTRDRGSFDGLHAPDSDYQIVDPLLLPPHAVFNFNPTNFRHSFSMGNNPAHDMGSGEFLLGGNPDLIDHRAADDDNYDVMRENASGFTFADSSYWPHQQRCCSTTADFSNNVDEENDKSTDYFCFPATSPTNTMSENVHDETLPACMPPFAGLVGASRDRERCGSGESSHWTAGFGNSRHGMAGDSGDPVLSFSSPGSTGASTRGGFDTREYLASTSAFDPGRGLGYLRGGDDGSDLYAGRLFPHIMFEDDVLCERQEQQRSGENAQEEGEEGGAGPEKQQQPLQEIQRQYGESGDSNLLPYKDSTASPTATTEEGAAHEGNEEDAAEEGNMEVVDLLLAP